MRIGIDCTNIRAGGGLTIVAEFLNEFRPGDFDCESITVWCNSRIGAVLQEANTHADIRTPAMLDREGPSRFVWRAFRFPAIARKSIDLLFIPGGLPAISGIRNVSMSLNLLPFMPEEYRRDGSIRQEITYRLLRFVNFHSLAKADGAIFLNENARKVVFGDRFKNKPIAIFPLGVDERFFVDKRAIRPNASISFDAPFRVLYVSTVNGYKHQWHVANAIADLRNAGLPVNVDFVGGSYPAAEQRLRDTIKRHGGRRSGSRYLGKLPHDELQNIYHSADAFVFASTCENMPNICLEAMASALPIASSDSEPMRTLLDECAVFFDAEDPVSIAAAIRKLAEDESLRNALSARADKEARRYSWSAFYNGCMAFMKQIHDAR